MLGGGGQNKAGWMGWEGKRREERGKREGVRGGRRKRGRIESREGGSVEREVDRRGKGNGGKKRGVGYLLAISSIRVNRCLPRPFL